MKFGNNFDELVYPADWDIYPMLELTTGRYFIRIERISYIPSGKHVIGRHEHPNFEFHFCSGGFGTVIIGDIRHDIHPRNFYITGPHIFHSQFSDSENPNCELCLMAELSPLHKSANTQNGFYSDLDNILDIITENKDFFGTDENSAATVLENIRQNMISGGGTMNTSEFWLDILNTFILTAKNICSLPQSLSVTSGNENLDSKRISYLDSVFRGYHDAMSPEIAAKNLCISVRHLNRIVERLFGMSFKQKYIQSRMHLAADLLESFDNITIDELSQKLNFNSAQYFSRTFKKFYGVSPSEYRTGRR